MAEAGPDDETLEHAQWLLARTQRSVSATGSHAEGIRATAELLEAMDRLLRMWIERDRPAAARLAIEQVRRVERSEDLGLRCTLLLRTADVLERIGDAVDAQSLRAHAFHRLGSALGGVDIALAA